MILLIDNYDSFTYNLVQMIEPMGQDVKVYRNDEIDIPAINALSPARLMISPGPCTPDKAGISISAGSLAKKFRRWVYALDIRQSARHTAEWL